MLTKNNSHTDIEFKVESACDGTLKIRDEVIKLLMPHVCVLSVLFRRMSSCVDFLSILQTHNILVISFIAIHSKTKAITLIQNHSESSDSDFGH